MEKHRYKLSKWAVFYVSRSARKAHLRFQPRESKQIIAYTELPGGASDMIFEHQQLSCISFFSYSFSMVTRQNSTNDLINIGLELQAADVKFPCKWGDTEVGYESGYSVDPDAASVEAAAHSGARVWSAPAGINTMSALSPVSKNSIQSLLPPREKSLPQSCSLAPSAEKNNSSHNQNQG